MANWPELKDGTKNKRVRLARGSGQMSALPHKALSQLPDTERGELQCPE